MHAEGNYSHDILANTPPDHWRSQAQETKAGGMTGMGIHLLDAFSFLVGPMARVSALSTRRTLPLPSGDTTAALIAFKDGATGTIATTLKTPFVWRLAVYGSNMWVESTSETCITACRLGEQPDCVDLEDKNHIGMNIEFVRARCLGAGHLSHRRRGDPAHGIRAGGGVPLRRSRRRLASGGVSIYETRLLHHADPSARQGLAAVAAGGPRGFHPR